MPASRTTPIALLTAVAIAFAGCGGSGGSGGGSDEPTISAADATAAVEQAAGVRLTSREVPDDAREAGVESAADNTGTAAADRQVVFVYVAKDVGAVDELREELASTQPERGVDLFTHRNIVVVYGSAGTDRGDAVERAVTALG